LTEADAIADEDNLYTSGRGRVRAISRRTGEEVWRASDLGRTPEMALIGDQIIVRTGGQFLRLSDGESVARGPYGVSALDRRTGNALWRFKGADKGLTNFVQPDAETILIADRDDLITLDAASGKRRNKVTHKIGNAAFVILNERNEAIVGGREEIAAFDAATGIERWRVRHESPGRGVLRTVAAIAARAGALYFRYGNLTTTAFRGVQFARAASSLRWSGLASRLTISDLTTLAANRARERVTARITTYGIASRINQARNIRLPRAADIPRPSIDVEERLLDRLDPAQGLERLSRFLLRRERLATLRGDYMYFYTNLNRIDDDGGRGLAGVNVNTGRTERTVRVRTLDARFLVDETIGLLYTASDRSLFAYNAEARRDEVMSR
jgi:hypothetical protein